MIKTIISVALIYVLALNGLNENLDFIKTNVVEEVTKQNFGQEVIQYEDLVFVEFYATWCNPCNELSPVLDDVAKKVRDIKFTKIDVDYAVDLKNQYNISAVPTMIILKNGEELDRHVGTLKDYEIIDWLRKYK